MALGDDLIPRLGELTVDEANNVPFGVIQVDREGRIQLYNRCESNLAGVQQDQATGQNFFTELAPCLNNDQVWGQFKRGVESGSMDVQISTMLAYRMRPASAHLRLYKHPPTSSYWVFVNKA